MSEGDLTSSIAIACTLSEGELASRRNELLPGILGRADSQDIIPGGFRWRFIETSGLLNKVVSAIEAERRCCQFLRFRLTLEPDGGPFWLEVTGPEGTQDFLRSLLSNPPVPSASE